MKRKLITFLLLFCLIGILVYAGTQPAASTEEQAYEKGVLYPDLFGAKGNGRHDDTYAIQMAIDSLVKIGGGTVRLGSGTYLVGTLRLGPKVSLVGNGNGATVIKQAKGEKDHCLIVKDISAALKIADLTLLGENENTGIFFEESGGYGENHHYLYTNTAQWDKSQGYKWVIIDNVCVYKFETGLHIKFRGFNINICNSTFSFNGNGVIMSCTDSFMYNCYVTNNRRNGLVVVGGDDKISNIKSIFNGSADAKSYGGIVVKASGCQIMNCETQDNYGKGFIVEGMYNSFTNCMSNTDGYSKDPFQYDPKVEACGFMIKNLYNTFSNCVVMNYNEKYGAVYHSPVIIDKSVSYYYPDIFNDIKVLNAPDRLMFNEPFNNVQVLSPKNKVEKLNIETIKEGKYFVSNQQNVNSVIIEDLHLSSLQFLVDYRSTGKGGRIIELDGDNSLSVNLERSSIVLYWNGKKEVGLLLDDDVVMDKDDIRLVVSFSQYGTDRYVQLLMFEKTATRGWIKKAIRQETKIVTGEIKNLSVFMGDDKVLVKRLIITQSPLPESVFLPSSNTNRVYDSALVYVDADAM